MKKLLAVAVLALAVTAGCTTSGLGQVVTNVSPDGRGGINVEKGTLMKRTYSWMYVTDVWVADIQTVNMNLGGK